MARALHVAGESGPDEGDDGAVPVGGVDAGAADLDEIVADGREAGEVELALRVEPSGYPGPVRRQQAVGGDDLVRGGLADQQVVAVGVERVAVETGFGAFEAGAELTGEDLVAQALGSADVLLAGGEADPVGGRFRGAGRDGGRDGRGGGQHGHGSLRGRIS